MAYPTRSTTDTVPRLTHELLEAAMFVRVGDTEFRIPRDLFNSPGDTPNYFSLGFAAFSTSLKQLSPRVDQPTLLCPPSTQLPTVPGRSSRIFADLLQVLKGYPLHIGDEEHRARSPPRCPLLPPPRSRTKAHTQQDILQPHSATQGDLYPPRRRSPIRDLIHRRR